jgi:aromatic-L-amino-acid decarboxylase
MKLTREQMREIGYRTVDRLIDHFDTMPQQSTGIKRTPAELYSTLKTPFAEQGMEFADAMEILERDVFANRLNLAHPRFFAFVPGPSNFVSAMADALASGLNVFAGSWLGGSGPAALEMTVIDWLAEQCGFPASTEGLCVSGGSMANLTALAVARFAKLQNRLPGAVAYYSGQTHSSLIRAFQILGFGADQLRPVACDAEFRISLPELARAIEADAAAGLRPFCIVANAGTTSTGSVDPFEELAAIARQYDMWLHADGAYGAAAMLCERGRSALNGMELCDSLSVDPHKWLFQPFELGCVLVKEGKLLKQTFEIDPEYLQDVHRYEKEINFCDRGIQLTREFRALKLWLSLRVFGVAEFRKGVARGFELADLAEAELRKPGDWEIMTPSRMAIVSFRHVRPVDHQKVVERMMQEGFAMLSSTVLNGHGALRMCTINPNTTDDDIVQTVQHLCRAARDL